MAALLLFFPRRTPKKPPPQRADRRSAHINRQAPCILTPHAPSVQATSNSRALLRACATCQCEVQSRQPRALVSESALTSDILRKSSAQRNFRVCYAELDSVQSIVGPQRMSSQYQMQTKSPCSVEHPPNSQHRKAATFVNGGCVIKPVLAVMLWLLVFYIYQRQTGSMSPQSQANLAAAENPSLLSAIANYPTYWPPLYPSALWVSAHLGLPVRYFNLLCYYILLVLVYFFFRRYVTSIHPAFPVLLLALTHSSYVNIYQPVSESLFVLLGFCSMLLIAQYRTTPSVYTALLLGVVSSTASLTRFFGLFWVVLVSIVSLWFSPSDRSFRKRAFHLVVYVGVLAISVVPWLLRLKRLTGSFSGMDRSAARYFPESISNWSELTDFSTNVKFSVKTIFIDFFSFSRSASHEVVNNSLVLPKEYAALLFVLLLTILLTFAVAHAYFHRAHSYKTLARGLFFSPKALPVHFAIAYALSIIVLWSMSNNDPIYTRFMYPSYVFIVLSVFSLYSWIQDHRDISVWHKMPFYLMYVFYISMNLLKITAG